MSDWIKRVSGASKDLTKLKKKLESSGVLMKAEKKDTPPPKKAESD
jgi:hypothetical protein